MYINGYAWYQWILFFFVYSFFGWIWESCYVSVKKKRWVNRGFLHLPMLPLYGSGACLVLFVAWPVRDNLVLLYLSGMIGASLLECVTGLVMEAVYKVKYWDYSDKFLNFKGVICLEASLLWGVFSVLMTKVVHVPIASMLERIPVPVIYGIEVVVGTSLIYDFIISNREALQLAHVLTAMENAKAEMQQSMERMQKELAEQRQLMEERLNDAKDHAEEQIVERLTAALERMDSLDPMESFKQAAGTVMDQAKAETAHSVEAVRLNLVFHSDALMKQMISTKESYTKMQGEMMQKAEELSRGMMLRNPTAKISKKTMAELSDQLRQRAIAWVEHKGRSGVE